MSFTMAPFLYQTRTILRIPAPRASTIAVRALHKGRETTIPFDYELGPRTEDDIDEATTPGTTTRGTITSSERRVFERIFADIEARGLNPAAAPNEKYPPLPGKKRTGAARPDPANVSRAVMLIMQQAAQDAGQSLPNTVTAPALLSGAARDRAGALLRFPPELRDAAGRALDTVTKQAYNAKGYVDAGAKEIETPNPIDYDWVSQPDTLARTVELEDIRFPERARIEGLLNSAASDFELWDILEKEVFSMPARLGIMKGDAEKEDPDSDAEPSAHDGDDTAADADVSNEDTAAASLSSADAEPQRLSLYVHGPLYPAYVLLGLRRLNSAFREPSPLVFSLLPRIKALGIESYVLGVSTPLFNELLTIHWKRRGDLSGVLDLLEEMRHCGLYLDVRTAAVLNMIDAETSTLARGLTGSGFGRALMTMPEYEESQRQRIRHWQKAAGLSVHERPHHIGFAEESFKDT